MSLLIIGSLFVVGRASAVTSSTSLVRSLVLPMSAPAVEVSPVSGALNGGTAVTVTVSAGVPANPIVLFGGAQATSVVTTSATTLTAVTPPSASFASGGVTVEVGDGSVTQSATAAYSYNSPSFRVFNNGKLRFGGGGEQTATIPTIEDSILYQGAVDQADGVLRQPFYKSSNGNWYKLTYSGYPLNLAVGAGTGSGHWTGSTVVLDPKLTSFATDYTNYVPTSYPAVATSSAVSGYGVIVSSGQLFLGGVLTEIRQRYEMTSTSAYVKVTTSLTNLSTTSALTNAHVWVGTRDDYVGISDSVTKEKGNIQNGAFVSVSAQSDSSSALQITSGSEGVLFYSTDPNSGISVHPTLGFANPVNQAPTASAITLTGDDSYALHVPFGTIAIGTTSETVWFYAAGEIAALSAVVNQVSQAAPTTTTTTTTTTAGPPPTTPSCCFIPPQVATSPAPQTSAAPPSTAAPSTARPTVPGSSVPAVPITAAPGSLPAVPPGQSVVTQNGQVVPVTIQQTSQGQWQISGAGFQMSLGVPQPGGITPSGGGEITLIQNRSVDVSGQGFQPGSLVDVWLFSTPRFLGTVRVAADGTFNGALPLPAGVPVGPHTLQANGVTPDAQVRSLNLGVRVTASNPRLPVTGDSQSPVVRFAMLLVSLGVIGLALPRLRRGRPLSKG